MARFAASRSPISDVVPPLEICPEIAEAGGGRHVAT
jgi:hypothetical protein